MTAKKEIKKRYADPVKGKKMTTKKPATKKEPKKRILKQDFNQQKFDNILNRLSFSSLGVVASCKLEDVDPHYFYNWLNGNEERLQAYTRARERQADFLADEIIEISNDSTGDKKTIYKDGALIEVEDKEFASRSKLKVDARKWIASKLKPKKYGDKIEVDQKTEHSGTVSHVITGMTIVDRLENEDEFKEN